MKHPINYFILEKFVPSSETESPVSSVSDHYSAYKVYLFTPDGCVWG
jgi:hypothetical protein